MICRSTPQQQQQQQQRSYEVHRHGIVDYSFNRSCLSLSRNLLHDYCYYFLVIEESNDLPVCSDLDRKIISSKLLWVSFFMGRIITTIPPFAALRTAHGAPCVIVLVLQELARRRIRCRQHARITPIRLLLGGVLKLHCCC